MIVSSLPGRLFAQPIVLKDDSVGDRIPRGFSDRFELKGAQLGTHEAGKFIAALAKGRPTVLASRSLVNALRKIDERPVVICSPFIDLGMMRSLAGEGISYIKDADNAYLPFLGSVISSSAAIRTPRLLSPQAQRIFLNFLAGEWDGLSASELAKRTGMSNASITKYIAEIEAIEPSVVVRSWKRCAIENPGAPKECLLESFEPYLSSPVRKCTRLANPIPSDLLASCGAKVSGESALAYYSDLAHNPAKLTVALEARNIPAAREMLGALWTEAPWYEESPLTVEEWPHPIETTCVSRSSAGMDCVKPEFLYACMLHVSREDVRLTDAIAQVRKAICL